MGEYTASTYFGTFFLPNSKLCGRISIILLHTLDFELPFSETLVVSAPRRALKILVWWKFYSFVFHNITFCIIVLSIISVSVIHLSILDKYPYGSLYARPRFEQGIKSRIARPLANRPQALRLYVARATNIKTIAWSWLVGSLRTYLVQ